jgi:DNA-binding GntR family transcriptional regulator
MTPTLETPEKRLLLKDRAYNALKQLILGETFAGGSFLSERGLVARLGMSKTPIRAALERLEHEGFVTVSPQQGIVVREFSLSEVIDLFDIRVALESFVVTKLAGKLSPEQVGALEENLQQQAERVSQGDVAGMTEPDANFHLLLCEFLGNREILSTMRGLREKLFRVVFRVSSGRRERVLEAYKEHQAIFEALLEGNATLAGERMQSHLEYGKRFLLSR